MTRAYSKRKEPTTADRVFTALVDNPYGLKVAQLIEKVYPDADRQPDWADRCIYIAIMRLKANLDAEGGCFQIGKVGLGRYSIFIRQYQAPKVEP